MIGFQLGSTSVDMGGINQLMRSENGDVARYIRLLAYSTQRTAQGLVGVRTGRLKNQIRIERDSLARTGYGMKVIADTSYALLHHQGAKPHTISAPPGRRLKFRGSNGTAYPRTVRHPGARANPYLLEALRLVVR